MKKVVVLFLAISIALLLCGFVVDWRSYVSNFSQIESPFTKIMNIYNTLVSNVKSFPNFSSEVTDFGSFFTYIGDFFSWLGSVLANGFVILVSVPYTIIEFIVRFALCAIGINSITPYAPNVL